MTSFVEMTSLVTEQTRRPEVPAITEAAIRTATLRAHHVDFFRRDLTTHVALYAVSPTAMFYDFPSISTTLPRLRSIKSVDGITMEGYKIEQLEYRDTDDLYDNDGAPRRYVYTLQGDTLRCYFDMPTGRTDINYFQNPNVAAGFYSSWIADTYPDQLAQWAAGIVMNRLGFQDIAQSIFKDHVEPFKEQLLASHLFANVV